MTMVLRSQDVVFYPSSDGEEMGSTGPHVRWVNLLFWGLTDHLRSRPQFIAADMMWYPIAGNIKVTTAPDLFVVLDPIPRDDPWERRVWVQADEGGKAPQVVFEILSDSNTTAEILKKRAFYEEYGVEELYEIEPELQIVSGFIRKDDELKAIERMEGWVSPLLNIVFRKTRIDGLLIGPVGGKPFRLPNVVLREKEEELERKNNLLKLAELEKTAALKRAEDEKNTALKRAEDEKRLLEQSAKEREEALLKQIEKLRALAAQSSPQPTKE